MAKLFVFLRRIEAIERHAAIARALGLATRLETQSPVSRHLRAERAVAVEMIEKGPFRHLGMREFRLRALALQVVSHKRDPQITVEIEDGHDIPPRHKPLQPLKMYPKWWVVGTDESLATHLRLALLKSVAPPTRWTY